MEPNISKVLEEFSDLPRFDDGRINYHNVKKAPVLICFVRFNGKILLLKRSQKVGTYRGQWSTVAGFIDDRQKLSDKVREELEEEIGMKEFDSIKFGKPYIYDDKEIGVKWLRFPVLVDLKKEPKIKLDFEHETYEWVKPSEIRNYKTTPGFAGTLKRVI